MENTLVGAESVSKVEKQKNSQLCRLSCMPRQATATGNRLNLNGLILSYHITTRSLLIIRRLRPRQIQVCGAYFEVIGCVFLLSQLRFF